MSDVDGLVQMARAMDPLREPVLRAAIRTLDYPPGSRGLDAGCGPGLQAVMLAEAVGPLGRVTGLDLAADLLAAAEEVVQQAGQAGRVVLSQGDVRRLPFEDDTFDWAWSVDCVGYAPMEPLPLVQELARVVRPGGSVAILAWSSENLLPGYPVLEARLKATASGIAPFARERSPASHMLHALGWFREAGLEEPTARTFAGQAHAPLTDELRDALIGLLEMRWPDGALELRPRDRVAYQRLCLPTSPDFIVDQPNYYAFFTYSMFEGRVAL